MKKILPILIILIGMLVTLIVYQILKDKAEIKDVQAISFDGEVTFKLMDKNEDIESIHYMSINDGTQNIYLKDRESFLEKYIYNHENFYKRIKNGIREYIILVYEGYYFTIYNNGNENKNIHFTSSYAVAKGEKYRELAFDYFSQHEYIELGEENEYFDIINSYEDAKEFYKESVNAKFDDENKEIFLKASNLSLRTTQDNVEKLEGYPIKMTFYEEYFIVNEVY